MKKPFTGRHMAITICSGFGVVIAVNLYMASHAVSGFGGVVVQNSYVASQEFNGWLEQAEQQKALGWEAKIARASNDRLEIETKGVPAGALVSAMIRRPLGQPETTDIIFTQNESGQFISSGKVPAGRWIVRLNISADGHNWSAERQIQ